MHLTRRAVLLLLITAPLIAASTWAPVLAWVALGYFLICAGLFSLDYRLAEPLTRLEVTRSHQQKLNLGVENPVTLTLHNRGRRTVTFWLRDEPPDEFKIETRIHDGLAAPRQAWQSRYMVVPRQRGNYRFGDLTLRWLGPLGLLVRQARIQAASHVKVYPNLLDVQRYDLLLRRNHLQEMGLRHSRQRGEGTEYERLREYLPDDDFRRIDWKATARRTRPITIEYETERSQNIFLAIDTGRMMQSPVEQIAKLDYVINSALLLTYVAIGKGDKVGLVTFADQVGAFLSAGQGKGQFYKALELLYAVRPQPVEPDYHTGLSYLALKQRKRSLIVLFTDITGGRSMHDLVSHAAVLQRTHLVLVVTIADPDVLAAAHQQPQNTLSAYQRAAAGQILEDRQLALDRLRRQGVLVLDTPANRLSTDVINRYLELKGQTRL
jgi:uncharacterized protein (DUF58 family)